MAYMKVKHPQLTPEQAQWLHHNVDLQRYHLHTGFGGRGWRFNQSRDGYYLEIDDDRVATMFLLKWSDHERIRSY